MVERQHDACRGHAALSATAELLNEHAVMSAELIAGLQRAIATLRDDRLSNLLDEQA